MRAAYALQGAAFLLLFTVMGVLFSRSAHAPVPYGTIISTTTSSVDRTLTLSSPAFADGGLIPVSHTCDGVGTSPELHLSGVPKDAQSLVLIMDDPDSPTGTWDHWVVFNIPPSTTVLKEGIEPEGVGGISTFGTTGYGGPCPGKGTHHYQFKLYALDTMLALPEGSTKQDVERALQGHVLAQATLTGLYQRNK